jgi:inactive STAND
MPSIQHIQRQREELQQQYDLLSEKIRRLRHKSAIEAGTLVAFQLEKEIERVEVDRDRVERQVEALGRLLNNERLHGELFRLNYTSQVRLFREFVEAKRVGAFLVHGEPEHGQLFLIKRLLYAIPETAVTPSIQFHLSRRAFRTDVATLWRELGRQIGVSNLSSIEEIRSQVVVRLRTQHVILVFHDLDCVDETYLDELIRDFWLPLASLAQPGLQRSDSFLLMFLIDQDGCVGSWNVNFAEQLDSVWEPCVPIRMPMLDRLSEQVLANWMENAIDSLPTQFTKKIDATVEVILKESEGIPERVFAQIYGLCGCNWQEVEDRWQKL